MSLWLSPYRFPLPRWTTRYVSDDSLFTSTRYNPQHVLHQLHKPNRTLIIFVPVAMDSTFFSPLGKIAERAIYFRDFCHSYYWNCCPYCVFILSSVDYRLPQSYYYNYWTKFGKFWHYCMHPPIKCHKVINSQKQSGFFGPPCTRRGTVRCACQWKFYTYETYYLKKIAIDQLPSSTPKVMTTAGIR